MTEPILGTSHGKINWWLRVGPVRPDGYHELETVFQQLELAEQVTISAVPRDECILTGFPADIPAEGNLVYRAWRLMKAAFPEQVSGVHFSIIKTLPQGGGLGGGSSNAAWTINAIDQLYQLNTSPMDLHHIGAQLGSDVAFFLKGGTAIGRGRGEMLETMTPCPKYWLVLMFPLERMSTAEGYRLLDTFNEGDRVTRDKAHTLSSFLTSLYSSDPYQLADVIVNDFDKVVGNYPWYRKCRDDLMEAGAIRAFLCGSGSTVAGLVQDQKTAFEIAERVGGIPTCTPDSAALE